MVFGKINWLVFVAIVLTAQKAVAADLIYSEVLLKKLNQRIERVLSESTEAQVFLEEDLTGAIQTLDRASVKWENTFSQYPFLNSDSGKKTVGLSKFMSFNTTITEQVVLVTEILFNIKRQLDGSTLFVPKARIQLFAQKFSPRLLNAVDDCSLSLSPLSPTLTRTQRDEFTTELVSLIESREYAYESTWANNVIWLEVKERTDGGCRGNNRNIMEIKLTLVSLQKQMSEELVSVSGTSCGYSDSHKDEAMKNLIKKMKRNLPKCNRAFRNF
jgi:hypothetical protein